MPVGADEAVAIMDANSAGNATAIKAIAGLISKTVPLPVWQWCELFSTFSGKGTLDAGGAEVL